MRQKIQVLKAGKNWKVKCDHCDEEDMDTQAEAIVFARKHVANLPAGVLSQIIIQGRDGQFRTEWTYGKDPFPPKG